MEDFLIRAKLVDLILKLKTTTTESYFQRRYLTALSLKSPPTPLSFRVYLSYHVPKHYITTKEKSLET